MIITSIHTRYWRARNKTNNGKCSYYHHEQIDTRYSYFFITRAAYSVEFLPDHS